MKAETRSGVRIAALILAISGLLLLVGSVGLHAWAADQPPPTLHAAPGNVECDNQWSIENDPLCQPQPTAATQRVKPYVNYLFTGGLMCLLLALLFAPVAYSLRPRPGRTGDQVTQGTRF